MKVFDCFPYWREYKHAVTRRQLWDTSSHDVQMIAVVGSHTHSGSPITFTDPIRDGNEPGIHTYFADIEMPGSNGWGREFAQRGEIASIVKSIAADDDLIIFTDVDEIVDPRMIDTIYRSCVNKGPVSLSMVLFYYGLEWIASGMWVHGKAFLAKDMPDDVNALRTDLGRYAVSGAGWHMSWHGTDSDRAAKAMAFSHEEFANEEGIKIIKYGAKHGFDPHGNKLIKFDADVLPAEIVRNLSPNEA